jgi:hypothetical protein
MWGNVIVKSINMYNYYALITVIKIKVTFIFRRKLCPYKETEMHKIMHTILEK